VEWCDEHADGNEGVKCSGIALSSPDPSHAPCPFPLTPRLILGSSLRPAIHPRLLTHERVDRKRSKMLPRRGLKQRRLRTLNPLPLLHISRRVLTDTICAAVRKAHQAVISSQNASRTTNNPEPAFPASNQPENLCMPAVLGKFKTKNDCVECFFKSRSKCNWTWVRVVDMCQPQGDNSVV
jgi:hypothetical protein